MPHITHHICHCPQCREYLSVCDCRDCVGPPLGNGALIVAVSRFVLRLLDPKWVWRLEIHFRRCLEWEATRRPWWANRGQPSPGLTLKQLLGLSALPEWLISDLWPGDFEKTPEKYRITDHERELKRRQRVAARRAAQIGSFRR